MSDMSHVYNAYAAVHNSEKRNNLSEVRDQISEMNLRQLTDGDLYEVAEEVLEEVFSNGTSLTEAQELVESIFKKAAEGDISPVRVEKLERLGEAFVTAFEKVKERSLRTAVESYSEYRRNKERLEKWNDNNSTGSVNQKLHDRLVGEDRLVVKTGLKTMIEAASPAAKEEKLRKDDKLFGSPNTYETKKKAEVLGALKKRDLDKKTKEKIAADIVKKKGDTSKSDDRYAYEDFQPSETVSKLAESGRFSREELWKIFDVEEELKNITEISSGKLLDAARASEVARGKKAVAGDREGAAKEVKRSSKFFNAALGKTKSLEQKIKSEGYQRNPEKGEEEARKADKRSAKQKRMDDPHKGINSPAFQEFMRSRGM